MEHDLTNAMLQDVKFESGNMTLTLDRDGEPITLTLQGVRMFGSRPFTTQIGKHEVETFGPITRWVLRRKDGDVLLQAGFESIGVSPEAAQPARPKGKLMALGLISLGWLALGVIGLVTVFGWIF